MKEKNCKKKIIYFSQTTFLVLQKAKYAQMSTKTQTDLFFFYLLTHPNMISATANDVWTRLIPAFR